MSYPRTFCLVLASFLACLNLTACGGSQTTGPTEPEPEPTFPLGMDDLHQTGYHAAVLADQLLGRALVAVAMASSKNNGALTLTGTLLEGDRGWTYVLDSEFNDALGVKPRRHPLHTFRFLEYDPSFPPAIEQNWATVNGRWFWGDVRFTVEADGLGVIEMNHRGWADGYDSGSGGAPPDGVRFVNFDRSVTGSWQLGDHSRTLDLQHWGRSEVREGYVGVGEVIQGDLAWAENLLELNETRIFDWEGGAGAADRLESWRWKSSTRGRLDGSDFEWLDLIIEGVLTADTPAGDLVVGDASGWQLSGGFVLNGEARGDIAYERPLVEGGSGPAAVMHWPSGEMLIISPAGVPAEFREHCARVTR